MKSLNRTAKSRRQLPATSDPLVFVKADELRVLGIDLDDLHSALLGQALNGDNEAYGYALIVKQAADLVAELRLNI
jgi:hypothetical protein